MDLYRFLVDLGTPFSKLFGFLGPKKVYLFMLVFRLLFLMIFGFGFGCLGLQNQAFGKGDIAKNSFQRSWNSNDSMVHFLWFWVFFGPICMVFFALETGLRFDEFSR